MSETKETSNSYRNILKATSILGGVQVYQMLITLIRGKFVALLLGPSGMGINALFNSLSLTLSQFASLGLNIAIVKEVAVKKEDPHALSSLVALIRRLLLTTALTGALISLLFSRQLSLLTFGTTDYSIQFMLLSLMVFFSIAGNGLYSILQGLHDLKRIARASLIGSIAGLIIGVPLYYFFGNDGIVPAMIAVAATTFLAFLYGVRKNLHSYPKIKFAWQSAKPLARKLLMMGFILMAGDLFLSCVSYITNLFVRSFGDIADVGLFQGANSLTNQYSGVVFTAMLLDFFPRLSRAANDNLKMAEVVNRQLEIIALIVAPLLSLLIMFAPIVVKILLSDDFESIVPLIRWMSLGVMIKALMFPLGYITFAKDNKKIFFWLEAVGCNLLTLVCNCTGYYFFGLLGLSYALIIDCSACFFIYCVINRHLYGYSLNREAANQSLFALMICAGVFLASLIEVAVISYSVMGAIITGSAIYSCFYLRKKLREPK